MGANDYSESRRVAKCVPTKDVFAELTDEARHEHGAGGYTGTIAEKHDFKMVKNPPSHLEAVAAFITTAQSDDVLMDKWGPANCIRISVSDTEDDVIFFGCASS